MTTATLPARHKTLPCRLHCRKVSADINLASISEVFSNLPGATILGGNPAKANADGFSYWAAKPKEIFEFRAGQIKPFEKLQRALDKYRLMEAQDDLPKEMLTAGWVGYFGYELGGYIERLPEPALDDLNLPLIRLCFYDRVIAYDHRKGNFRLIALEIPNDAESTDDKIASLGDLLAKAAKVTVSQPPPADLDNIDFSKIRCNMCRNYYFKAFEKIKRHIYDGDVYQINFSQRFDCDYTARPIDLFHWQNQYNPSPYSAYIDAGDFQIVSASPEMFITVKDRTISTKPIKGTRRRIEETSQTARQINAKNLDELLASEKEQAELNMIIDLERNDIARICVPGTRIVSQPRTIETYPTVFHAVATVSGELRDAVTFCDILKAMFPGGSITGAPKIRAMEIINQTEPTARGVYTGSIGFAGLDGNVSLNIAIRTVIIKNKSACAQTGGGIVADSDPQAEYDETLIKARALLAGIAAVNR
jgi:para-aminobenzoate synthetase component 1